MPFDDRWMNSQKIPPRIECAFCSIYFLGSQRIREVGYRFLAGSIPPEALVAHFKVKFFRHKVRSGVTCPQLTTITSKGAF
jgi:hypothetical protein